MDLHDRCRFHASVFRLQGIVLNMLLLMRAHRAGGKFRRNGGWRLEGYRRITRPILIRPRRSGLARFLADRTVLLSPGNIRNCLVRYLSRLPVVALEGNDAVRVVCKGGRSDWRCHNTLLSSILDGRQGNHILKVALI